MDATTQHSDQIDPAIDELLKDEWDLFDKYYSREELEEFIRHHKVEVLRAEDYQFHCYIDYKKGDDSWYSSMFNPLTAIVVGIKVWKEHNEK